MMKDKIYEDLSTVLKRANHIRLSMLVLFGFLLVCFWKVQILDHKEYWQKAEANRLREIPISAPRGLILDREGNILAENIASYKASVLIEENRDHGDWLDKVSQLLDLEKSVLEERIQKYRGLSTYKPIVIKDNLTLREVSRLEARKLELPELIIQADPKRYYPFGKFASHIIGYLQELSPEELAIPEYKDRRMGDIIGKTGVEKTYESVLAGTDGFSVEIVDSMGRIKGEKRRREPRAGNNIRLSLDFDIQSKAEELLEGKEGIIICLDVCTGGVYSLASYPDFDPNKFINRFTPEEWMALVNNPANPLENRAIRGLYSPGSVFKVLMALAALDLDVIRPSSSFYCGGVVRIYDHPYNCWYAPGHGRIGLIEAIRLSCNIYFYQLGRRMNISDIARYAKNLGYGELTGIDLPGEKKGLLPDPEWKMEVRNEPWYAGDTISVSIGQGILSVTPLQVAVHTAMVANRGKKVIPHLLMGGNRGQVLFPNHTPSEKGTDFISQEHFESVIKGMWSSVNAGGTARGARVQGFDVCGKTGSTQIVSRETAEKLDKESKWIRTHSWFTGFAPREQPRIVVTVLVEYGGMGGTTAAPLARQIFTLFREKYD
ncbi:MAG: penicillin-binding protein 2 [Candidatus Aminicenantes bacterium]|nr:penicillin-binding protein 2 [Candidatus Aminicenantes bacterium]